MKIEMLDTGLYRLCVPFEEIFTTVYIAVCEQGVALIDCATYPSDVDEFILPALQSLGIAQESVKYLLLTHPHKDHTGGAAQVLRKLQHVRAGAYFPMDVPLFSLLSDGDILLDTLQTVYLPGHTHTSVGFFDLRTKTLLSGDCLQLKGIGKYRNGVRNREAYLASVNKLKTMDICRIVAAHEYDPLGSIADGKEAVRVYLDTCIQTAL